MFLSKIFVDWSWAKNPYQLHRALWQLFPDQPEAKRDFLFRVEQTLAGKGVLILLQSEHEPEAASVAAIQASKSISLDIQDDVVLRFFLRANPVKTIKDQAQRKNNRGEIKSCRVPLIHDHEQIEWLKKKLDGAALLNSIQTVQDKPIYFRKENQGGKIQPVCFAGVIKVVEAQKFRSLLVNGIGPAKGMGCGLLSVAKAF